MESFQYDPIIHEEHAFRIVRLFAGTEHGIQAEIIHASFDGSDIVEYEAVSYVWGSSELVSSIDVGGKSLKITNNLELVLRDLRLPDQDRLLWIDGICIDQNKDKEKTHQVRQMRNIYQRAERVLFHIGPSTELTHILHETLIAIQRQQNLESGTPIDLVWDKVKESLALQYTDFGSRIRNSVESILSAPWFRRVWIVQEVANARRALIYWGHASFQVAGFVHLVQRLGIKIDDHQTSILDMMPQKRRSQSPWSHRQDLYNLLRRFKQAKATQNHDRIFALLSMCTAGKGHGTITVDYEKSQDVLISEVVAYISFCEKEDLAGFCRTFYDMGNFLGRVDSLLQDLVVHMATTTRLAGLRSLLSNRKDEVLVTESIVEVVICNSNTEPATLDFLLAHAPNRTMVSIPVLHKAVARANIDILRVIITYNSNANIVAEVLKSELAGMPLTGDGSNEDIILQLLDNSMIPLRDLCLAARNGNLDSIRKSLEEGADVNTIDPEGSTPLGRAATSGQRNVVEFLLASGAHIETGPQSPLSLAAEHGHKDIVRLLLDWGADIESLDRFGRTPLSLSASGGCRSIMSTGRSEIGKKELGNMIGRSISFDKSLQYLRIATSWKDVGIYRSEDTRIFGLSSLSHRIPEVYSGVVDLLLQRGANIETRDCLRASPLWWAVNWGHVSVVRTLLQQEAQSRLCDEYGLIPLSWALWNDHQEVVECLLDDHTPADAYQHGNPLFWAICNGSKTQVKWLLDKGFDTNMGATVNWAISNGCTSIVRLLLDMNASTIFRDAEPALSLAASTGHQLIVQVLLNHGEDVEIPNAAGSTPLMLAARKGHGGIVQLLLNKAANVNSCDYKGQTPLMHAVWGGSPDIVRVLIQNHAEVDAKTGDYDVNQTCLWQAAQNGHHEIASLLLEHGAHIEGHHSLRITPLMMACRFGHEETARLLLEHNAKIHAVDSEGHTVLDWAVAGCHVSIKNMLKEQIAMNPEENRSKRRRIGW